MGKEILQYEGHLGSKQNNFQFDIVPVVCFALVYYAFDVISKK